MSHYTESQIQAANQTDLAAFLVSRGEKLKRCGNQYLWERHQVWIHGYEWYTHYDSKGGYAVSFVMRYYGLTFQNAVAELLGESVSEILPSKYQPKPVKMLTLPQPNATMNHVYAYLMEKRFIARDVITHFAREKILYEDAQYHNCIFLGLDEVGVPKHCHRRATGSSFKCTEAGSQAEYAFHHDGESEWLFVFEAPVDMLLPKEEHDLTLEEARVYWEKALSEHLFVLCQTTMAVAITKRTLAGYSDCSVNAIYLTKLLDRLEDQKRLAHKLTNPATWSKEGERMKFDAIVGNPPYQAETGGGSDLSVAATQAKPIFQLFVQQAKKLNPEYISMIIPARWYAGGIGLNDFREEMLSDKQLRKLVDYSNSKDCFPTVDIAGGLCYFLWQNSGSGDCTVINHVGTDVDSCDRPLDEFNDIFIRSNKALSIIHKVRSKATKFMDDVVYPIDAFGFPSKARGSTERFAESIALIHSQGIGYITREEVKKNADLIDKYKITIGILVPSNGEVGIDPAKGYKSITMPKILNPGEVTTFSYLVLNALDTEAEALNFKEYMKCKFPRYMMRVTYSSMHISRANFIFVPEVDFTQEWTDQKLYDYFDLSAEERAIIERTMRPMDEN